MVDEIDKIVLSQLGRNARISSQNIATHLKDTRHSHDQEGGEKDTPES